MAGLSPNNSQITLTLTITNTDLISGGNPVTITRTVPALTYLPLNTCYFDLFSVSTNTPLIFLSFYAFLYVRNLATSANVTLAVTFNNGAAQSVFLPPGSIFLYGPSQPGVGGGAPNGNGIINLQGTSSTPAAPGGGSPIELFGAF